MMSVTDRLEIIANELDGLLEEHKSGTAQVPDAGRMVCVAVTLKAIVAEQRKRERRIALNMATGGMDHSIPMGDR